MFHLDKNIGIKMFQFTLDIVILPNDEQIRIYSVAVNHKSRRGLAIHSNGKVFLLNSKESGIWTRSATTSSFEASKASDIEESVFSDAILTAQASGVKNISSSAMRVVFAEDNTIRAHYLGATKGRSSTLPLWAQWSSHPIKVETLINIGFTKKLILKLLEAGLLKGCEATD